MKFYQPLPKCHVESRSSDGHIESGVSLRTEPPGRTSRATLEIQGRQNITGALLGRDKLIALRKAIDEALAVIVRQDTKRGDV